LDAEATLTIGDDTYIGFADRYDLFFEAFGEHPAEVEGFFRRVFERGCVRSVLDCACGTGHDLVLLEKLGLEVVGSDISGAMLGRARKNLTGLGFEIPLVKADFRDLRTGFDRDFDAVLCLSSSILEMPDEAEVLKAFSSMRQVLAEGGVLVLSQGTTDKQWKEQPRFILAVNRGDFSRLFVIDYDDSGARYNVLDIFHGAGVFDFKVWSVHYHMMLLRDDLERLLTQAGFGHIEFYGSYAGEPYDKTSSNILIAVAHKGAP
jgi:glycine/sarcosine N-methyltransferase